MALSGVMEATRSSKAVAAASKCLVNIVGAQSVVALMLLGVTLLKGLNLRACANEAEVEVVAEKRGWRRSWARGSVQRSVGLAELVRACDREAK